MSLTSKSSTRPLFVNHSQIQKYGRSDCMSAAAISDKDTDRRTTFIHSSPNVSHTDVAKQSSRVNDNNFSSVSPVFGRKESMQKSLGNESNSNGDSLMSSTELEDIDRQSYKRRRRRLHKRRAVIDSDDSNDDSDDCPQKASKRTSDYTVNNQSRQNTVTVQSNNQRLSALEHRHCFDLLLNYDIPNTVACSNTVQRFHRNSEERLTENDDCGHPVKSYLQSPCESVEGKIDENDRAEKVDIHSVSSQCSIYLHKMQLCDVPDKISLSQEDKLLLSSRNSPASSCKTSVIREDQLPMSSDLNCLSKVHVSDGAMQSSDVHYCSSDDLFSDDELVESVCLSPVECNQPEVRSASYSQAEEDCIWIGDSDDELFANLTQNDITIKVEADERHECDDCEEYISADDDSCMPVDTAAASRDDIGDVTVTLEECDPWIDHVADVSSDELEEAYNTAMIHARTADRYGSVNTESAAVIEDHSSDDTISISDANLKLLNTTTCSPCSVVLKHLKVTDIPPEIKLSQEQKCICQRDVFDDDSVMLSESTSRESFSSDIGDGNKMLFVSADVYKKPQAELKPSSIAEHVDIETSNFSKMSVTPRNEAVSDAVELVKDTEYVQWQLSARSGTFKQVNERLSADNSNKAVQNVDVNHKPDKRSYGRTALEKCIEVSEFYSTDVTAQSRDNDRQKHNVVAVSDLAKLHTGTDAKNRNLAGRHCSDKDQSLFRASEHSKLQKHESVQVQDDSASKKDEMKHTSLTQNFNNKTSSSVQSHKIAQIRDYDKRKLRRDKMRSNYGRLLQNEICNDRFMGLSQFSVAKQQLVIRNSQLKNDGMYYCCVII